MGKNRKNSIICALLCVASVLTSGCSKDGFQVEERKKDTVDLKFTGYKVGRNKVEEIEQILNAYMDEHKDTVIVYEGIDEDYVEVMTNRIENGLTEDLFMISDQALTTYAQNGWCGTKVMDLSDKKFLQRFSPMVKNLFTVDEKIMAVPMCMSVTGLMVNMDVLKDCGITRVPQTYDEWVADMRTVKEHGYTPMVNYQGNAASFNFLIAARSSASYIERGGAYEGAQTRIYEKGIRDIYALMDEGLIDRDQAAGETEARSYQRVLGEQFAAGGVAFAVVPSWGITSFLDGDPEFDYCLAGLPVGESGPIVNVRASLLVAVNNEGENKEQAEEFLDFMMQPEHIEGYASVQNGLSPLAESVPSDEIYMDISALIEAERFISDTDSRIPFNLVKRLNLVSEQMIQSVPVDKIMEDFENGTADAS